MGDFEGWFDAHDMPINIDLMRTENGFILKREVTPILREGAKFAWDYQQEKIEKLKTENEKLKD